MKTINGWMDGSLDGWVDGVSEFLFYVLNRIGTEWAGCRKEVPEIQVMSLLHEILLSHLHTHSLGIGQLYAQLPVHSFSHSTHLFHHPFVPNP